MRRRHRLAWKLSAVVLVIVSAVILVTGLLGNLLSQRYALDAARDVMQFSSSSIRNGIEKLMMSGDNTEAMEFIEEMSRGSATYQDMSLISHPSGRITVSRQQELGALLDISDNSCTGCHATKNHAPGQMAAQSEVITGSRGDRILQVITPIINEPSCGAAPCHVHAESGTVLGVLKTDYSLAEFDTLMNGLALLLVLAAIAALLLTICALLLMFRWFLAKPLQYLVAGVESLAADDLAFRFPGGRTDEIGLVENSFNNMAAQIEAQQREIRRGLEYLEAIVENTADLVITVNTKGLIKTFNRGAEQALGYTRDEVIGRKIEMLFAEPRERDAAIAKLQGKDNVTNWKTHFKTKGGDVRHILLTLSRLKDRKGNLIGTLGISKDITTEIDLQQKLIRSESEAAIGRAITAIQHAIKNMLNTLRGGLYVVRVGHKKNQEKRILEGCEMIEEGLSRISELSFNMLKYAREWKIEPEQVDLVQMAKKIIMAVSQTAADRGVTICTEVDDALPDIHCDPRLIHMGLMDIVSNALDACELKDYPEGEEPELVIRVYSAAFGRSEVVEVQDNGIGMEQEVKEHVFTPFFSTKKKWGTGLGLALTKRIIDLHDGEITVESEPENGTIFWITLPVKGPRKS
ncbi:MAG: ATP-binding protein [Candidatus Latescibacterota bacterium]